MAQSTILSPGAKIGGKFEVVGVIGFGGMGVVYKVREQVGGVSRVRALKTVLPQYAAEKAIVARFRQEAEKMCMLEHENIVPVLSYSEEGEFPYLVMPFIEGQTLKDYLASHMKEHGRPLPLSEVMAIGIELVRGLEVAHRFVNPETGRPQPMVHRDIKPGNIMVRVEERGGDRRLRVLLMDFGIAKILSDEDTGHTLTDVIGTVRYASPEQIKRGKDIDPRADIYSLGMVLYELYCGHHMFADLSEHMVLMRMMQREVEELPPQFPEETPQPFRDLIQRCVAVNRDRRYANVGEAGVVMRRILEEDSERLVLESRHARQAAEQGRQLAAERGATELAIEPLAEADAAFARAEAADGKRDYGVAASQFRAAASAFQRAADLAAAARERLRLTGELAALKPLRAAAEAAEAARLAAAEFAAAERAVEAAERALGSGELTASARAIAQAERAWREAEAKAARERVREEAGRIRADLDRVLATEAAAFEEIPESLRSKLGSDPLGAARAAAKAAAEAEAKGDLAAVRARVREGVAAAETAASARRGEIERAVSDLAGRLVTARRELESAGDLALVPDFHAQANRACEAAERARAEGRLVEAHRQFEAAFSALERLRDAVAAERRSQERARREAEAAAVHAARLSDLGTRRAELAARLSLMPADRARRRQVKAGKAALGRVEKALGQGDESIAAAALTDCEAILNTLAAEPEPTSAVRPWPGLPVFAGAGGVVVILIVGVFFLTQGGKPSGALQRPAPAAAPEVGASATTARSGAASLAVESPAVISEAPEAKAFASRSAPVPEPTVELPKVAPTVSAATAPVLVEAPPKPSAEVDEPSRIAAARIPEAVVEPPPAAPPVRPTAAQPPTLASARPASRSLEIEAETEQQFAARVKGADARDLVWELDGAQVGQGGSFVLKKTQTAESGRHDLQLVAERDGARSVLTTWQVNVVAPPVAVAVAKPPPLPTPAPLPKSPEPVSKPPDPVAEIRAWVENYCGAFERKDTGALIALGQLTSQAEATRLRDALSTMENLKVLCTSPSIQVSGDHATVSFDRTDRWLDPRGGQMERALPRITKNLQRSNGRWIVAP